eukprot:546263-Rhodomonas_salina.7
MVFLQQHFAASGLPNNLRKDTLRVLAAKRRLTLVQLLEEAASIGGRPLSRRLLCPWLWLRLAGVASTALRLGCCSSLSSASPSMPRIPLRIGEASAEEKRCKHWHSKAATPPLVRSALRYPLLTSGLPLAGRAGPEEDWWEGGKEEER